MSHGSGKKKHKPHEEEAHENHERWVLTYADMLTVLMALFIVLFAISQVDQVKFQALATGLANGQGGAVDPLSGGLGVLEKGGLNDPAMDLLTSVKPVTDGTLDKALKSAAEAEQLKDKLTARKEADHLREIQKKLEKALADKNMAGAAKFRIDERGLVMTIVTDKVLFAADRAELQEGGRRVIDAVVPVLRKTPNGLLVEGHTNTAAVRPKYFPSEWELSSTRASSVARYLVEDGIVAKRLTAVGYADQRPLYGKDNPRADVLNRRVELVVQTTVPDGVATLLKGEAKASAAEEKAATEEHATTKPATTEEHATTDSGH